MNAKFTLGSKYLTVVSKVEGNVFSNNLAKSASRIRAFMSRMTFYTGRQDAVP